MPASREAVPAGGIVTVRIEDAKPVGICLQDGSPPQVMEFGLSAKAWQQRGLSMGDTLLSINGFAAAALTRNQLNTLLTQRPLELQFRSEHGSLGRQAAPFGQERPLSCEADNLHMEPCGCDYESLNFAYFTTNLEAELDPIRRMSERATQVGLKAESESYEYGMSTSGAFAAAMASNVELVGVLATKRAEFARQTKRMGVGLPSILQVGGGSRPDWIPDNIKYDQPRPSQVTQKPLRRPSLQSRRQDSQDGAGRPPRSPGQVRHSTAAYRNSIGQNGAAETVEEGGILGMIMSIFDGDGGGEEHGDGSQQQQQQQVPRLSRASQHAPVPLGGAAAQPQTTSPVPQASHDPLRRRSVQSRRQDSPGGDAAGPPALAGQSPLAQVRQSLAAYRSSIAQNGQAENGAVEAGEEEGVLDMIFSIFGGDDGGEEHGDGGQQQRQVPRRSQRPSQRASGGAAVQPQTTSPQDPLPSRSSVQSRRQSVEGGAALAPLTPAQVRQSIVAYRDSLAHSGAAETPEEEGLLDSLLSYFGVDDGSGELWDGDQQQQQQQQQQSPETPRSSLGRAGSVGGHSVTRMPSVRNTLQGLGGQQLPQAPRPSLGRAGSVGGHSAPRLSSARDTLQGLGGQQLPQAPRSSALRGANAVAPRHSSDSSQHGVPVVQTRQSMASPGQLQQQSDPQTPEEEGDLLEGFADWWDANFGWEEGNDKAGGESAGPERTSAAQQRGSAGGAAGQAAARRSTTPAITEPITARDQEYFPWFWDLVAGEEEEDVLPPMPPLPDYNNAPRPQGR